MRKRRNKYCGATYHVTAKANRGEFILESDVTKEMFLEVLERAKKKYPFILKHFCIMGNHVHLLIKPIKGTDLSALMQWLLGVFAKRFNWFFGLIGHVWYDRFKSKIITDYYYFLNAFVSISQNPVKAGLCKKAEEYRYSGLWFLGQNDSLVEPLELPPAIRFSADKD